MLQTVDNSVDIRMLRSLELIAADATLHPTNREIAKFWRKVFRRELDQAHLDRLFKECHALINERVETLYAEWHKETKQGSAHKSFENWIRMRNIGYVIPGDFIAVPFKTQHMPVMPCSVAAEESFWAAGRSFKLMYEQGHEFMIIAEIH